MIQPLVTNEILLKVPARPATKDDIFIADDLNDTLRAHKDACLGLAGNMIGKSVAIINFYDTEDELHEMFNPKIIKQRDPYPTTEGCMCHDGERKTMRFKRITVTWEDREGKSHTRAFSGLTAEVIQHEIDHLKGILI